VDGESDIKTIKNALTKMNSDASVTKRTVKNEKIINNFEQFRSKSPNRKSTFMDDSKRDLSLNEKEFKRKNTNNFEDFN